MAKLRAHWTQTVSDCAQRSVRSRVPFALLIVALGAAFCVAAIGAHVAVPVVPLPDPGMQRTQIDLQGASASVELRRVAAWVMRDDTHKGLPFIIADKTGGLLFAFDANGRLLGKSVALFGAMFSDVLTAAQEDKTLDEAVDADKITPAGVFAAEGYLSESYGKSIRFAGYAHTNLLIHRAFNETRMKHLRSPAISDKHFTYGCINALPEFVDKVLLPNFGGKSVVIVMPETQSAIAFFAIKDANVAPRAASVRRLPAQTPVKPKDEKESDQTMVGAFKAEAKKKSA